MRRSAALIFVALMLIAVPASADFDELIKKVDRAWAERSGDTGSMKEAVKQAEQAYGEKPGFEAAWRAARACFWICDRTEDQKVDLEWGKRGYEWGEKAIDAAPGKVQGHYYYGICLGEYGKGMSIVKALAKGLGGKYEKALAKAISIDGAYDNAGPHRALGRYWYKLPWPKYSFEKAEKSFLAAKKITPKDSRNLFYMAELYKKEEDAAKLQQTLTELENLTGTPGDEWETAYYKRMGKKLGN